MEVHVQKAGLLAVESVVKQYNNDDDSDESSSNTDQESNDNVSE